MALLAVEALPVPTFKDILAIRMFLWHPYAELDVAVVAAERLRILIENHPFPGQDKPLKVTISLGVAMFPSQEVADEDNLISHQTDK